ncbi:uncharacterized protein A1O5_03088 [Cladophialophora psammophila CBS 110553]|uniref:Uncharacterized protein n=1 Tax=Cladophialophora psammophila CBS 110553 TaxID=1182543 RepID=W9WZH5_9EURO|nr:uncharacterized protein A1O5_03088 [Cladophialophora psammophila CBS 110553]EXJ73328.1 hypothetical protein A1O5_03088 [Cladophialophora psammophila CBS 110553]
MPEPENVQLPLRNPFQSSRSTQPPFATPSFTATPRFQRPTPRIKDDIQANFDEGTDPALLSNDDFNISRGDIIDLDDDVDHGALSPLYSRGARAADHEQDHVESEASPLQYRLRKSAPATKRRKVSHPGPGASVIKPVAISSSPDDDDPGDVSYQAGDNSPSSQSDLDDNLGRSTGLATINESSKIARFRPIAQGVSPPSPVSRTIFKVVPEDQTHGSGGRGPVLPDIFSPSRRKGKRDYILGGSAHLVRSWVLDIATQESHAESLSEEILLIAEVENDASGRFVVVSDEKARRWLLPEQQHEKSSRSSSFFDWSELRPGSQVLIKGRATRWPLDLESQGLENVVVAAYWELVSAG